MAVQFSARRIGLLAGAAIVIGLGVYGIVHFWGDPEKRNDEPPVVTPKKPEPGKKKLAPLPVNVARVLEPKADGFRHQLTKAWSSGKVYFTHEPMTFAIQRDYDQRLAIEVENRSKEGLSIVAEMGQLDDGVLGDFAGPGSAGRAVSVAAGAKQELSLHLFAQDARRSVYHSHVVIRDAASKEVLATAPIHVQVPLPTFALRTEISPANPATLARVLTITEQS